MTEFSCINIRNLNENLQHGEMHSIDLDRLSDVHTMLGYILGKTVVIMCICLFELSETGTFKGGVGGGGAIRAFNQHCMHNYQKCDF